MDTLFAFSPPTPNTHSQTQQQHPSPRDRSSCLSSPTTHRQHTLASVQTSKTYMYYRVLHATYVDRIIQAGRASCMRICIVAFAWVLQMSIVACNRGHHGQRFSIRFNGMVKKLTQNFPVALQYVKLRRAGNELRQCTRLAREEVKPCGGEM